jgi:hypothetical protein
MASRSVLHRTDAAALRFQVFSFAGVFVPGVFFAPTAIGFARKHYRARSAKMVTSGAFSQRVKSPESTWSYRDAETLAGCAGLRPA